MNCGFAPDHCRKRQQTEEEGTVLWEIRDSFWRQRRQGTVLRLLSPSRGDEEPSPSPEAVSARLLFPLRGIQA